MVEAVRYGDDVERPIIAGARFDKLPVPGCIAREIDDRLNKMRTITTPADSVSLASDPEEFPTALSDPVISDEPLREPFAWDSSCFVMWYDTIDAGSFDPTPYQIEDGAVTARSQAHQNREQPLPDSREALIKTDSLHLFNARSS